MISGCACSKLWHICAMASFSRGLPQWANVRTILSAAETDREREKKKKNADAKLNAGLLIQFLLGRISFPQSCGPLEGHFAWYPAPLDTQACPDCLPLAWEHHLLCLVTTACVQASRRYLETKFGQLSIDFEN